MHACNQQKQFQINWPTYEIMTKPITAVGNSIYDEIMKKLINTASRMEVVAWDPEFELCVEEIMDYQ